MIIASTCSKTFHLKQLMIVERCQSSDILSLLKIKLGMSYFWHNCLLLLEIFLWQRKMVLADLVFLNNFWHMLLVIFYWRTFIALPCLSVINLSNMYSFTFRFQIPQAFWTIFGIQMFTHFSSVPLLGISFDTTGC